MLVITPASTSVARGRRRHATIRATVTEVALKYPMWGHRKIAWLCRHEQALDVCDATCLRILRETGLTLPVDYVRERRDLAGARREAFVDLPTRRNKVWQMDFFELETSGGGTWRSGDIIDFPDQRTRRPRDRAAGSLRAGDRRARLPTDRAGRARPPLR